MIHFANTVGLKGFPDASPTKTRPMFGISTLSQAVNLHKLLCFPVIAGMISITGNWNTTTALYLAQHGVYGWCWLLKYAAFPNLGFEIPIHPLLFLFCFLSGGVHWITSWIIVNRTDEAMPGMILAVMCLWSLGMFLHYVSEAQKYFIIKHRTGKTLINDGLFRFSRNINYFGEIMIYLSWIILSGWHLAPLVINVVFWLGLFLPNMLEKDKSLAKYKGFDVWKRDSWLVIPWFL